MKDKEILFQINKEECVRSTRAHSFSIEKAKSKEGLIKDTTSVGENVYDSLWKKTARDTTVGQEIDDLPERIDVIVIGGGMAGVLIAYQLKLKGIDAIVIERGEIGRTCTANTTAKITSLHGAVYTKIARAYGKEKALKYYESQQKAISDYEKVMKQCNISCDYEQKSHIMYATTDLRELEKEYDTIKSLGISSDWVEHAPLPFGILGGIAFHDQAQFHPLKFIDQLIEGLRVYQNCMVTRIDRDGTIEVNGVKQIKAGSVVIATHYPIINSKGFYFTRLNQERSYVISLQQKEGFDIHDMYIDVEEAGHSFRPYQEQLIMGVGNHRSGKKAIKDYYDQLEKEAFAWFPNAKITHQWSNQDCMSLDHIPYIGQYSTALKNFYVATGFNQWGMSNSMVAADVISDLISTGSSDYADVYSPRRHQLSGAGTFLINTAISAYHLTKQLLHVKEDDLSRIKNGQAGIIKVDGKSVGVYKDQEGEIHAIDTKCPHLGCCLAWNPNELTWDCPCHGSRFDIDGHLIEDPAQKDAVKVEGIKEEK